MNVCMLTDKPLPTVRPTGVGIAAFSMALALSKRGNTVNYICRGEKDGTLSIGDNLTLRTVVHYSKDNLGASLAAIRGGAPDVVHVHSSAAAPSLVAAWALGRRTVFHSHGDQPLHPLGLTLVRSVEMSLSQRVIAVSERTRQDIIRNHGVPGSKVVVAYNGVDTDEFRPLPREPSVLQKYGLEEAEKLILSVGAVQARKGQMRMVECMPKVLSAWPGATYVNVGPTYDLAFTDSVLDRARELGVAGAVRLISGVPQEDLVALISAADLCVHPSSREPFGLAVVEEMACAKPVVALDSGALPEIIDNMVDGIIVGSMGRTLGDSILEILGDPALMRRMGAAARDKVTDKFTWDKTASRLEEIYRGLSQ
ncbi:MAG TPA: glycosyltransferase family 4 protein [Nitrososphaerales archaeon]|nr:glycosyltransferase family 4 protein [Nitrososphaerales archaeon]